MREAKPGPRCSKDAYESVLNTYGSYIAAKNIEDAAIKHVAMARENFHISDEAHAGAAEKELKQAMLNHIASENNLIQAQEDYEKSLASYYATPAGLNEIDNKLADYAGKQVKVFEGGFDGNSEWVNVSYVEHADWKENIVKSAAVSHHEWQKSFSKELNIAGFAANRGLPLQLSHKEREKLTFGLQTAETQLHQAKRSSTVAIHKCSTSHNSVDAVNVLREAKRLELTYTQYIQFAKIKLADLKSFESSYRNRFNLHT